MKFIVMVCAAFLARVKPVSTIAKPACMNITRNPATSVHTKLMATVFAAAAALAAWASESAAATPCVASINDDATGAAQPRPAKLIRSPERGFRVRILTFNSCLECTNWMTLRYYPFGWAEWLCYGLCITCSVSVTRRLPLYSDRRATTQIWRDPLGQAGGRGRVAKPQPACYRTDAEPSPN